MRVAMLVCVLMAVGACDKAKDALPRPTPVQPTLLPVASCVPFNQPFQVKVDMSGPTIYSISPVLPYELEERQANGSFQPHRSLGLHFNSRYRMRGSLNGCWSNYYEFAVGPQNPDGSGGKVPVVAAPVPVHACTDPRATRPGCDF